MREERAAFEDQFLQAAAGDDWVGLQIYTCARFGPDGLIAVAADLQTLAHGMERRPRRWAPRCAGAAEVLPDVPLLVTENGIATADDADRIRFTDEALRGPVGRDRRRRRRARLHALEPARQLRVDARLRAHLRPGVRRPADLRPDAEAQPGVARRGGPPQRDLRTSRASATDSEIRASAPSGRGGHADPARRRRRVAGAPLSAIAARRRSSSPSSSRTTTSRGPSRRSRQSVTRGSSRPRSTRPTPTPCAALLASTACDARAQRRPTRGS